MENPQNFNNIDLSARIKTISLEVYVLSDFLRGVLLCDSSAINDPTIQRIETALDRIKSMLPVAGINEISMQ